MRMSQVFYGWKIVFAGTLCNFLVLGLTVFGFGVFIAPMREELGWSVAAISAAFAIRTFENGFLAPVAGMVADRIGPRRLAIMGICLLAAGLALFSQVRSLWMLYLAAMIIAMGQSFGPPTAFSMAVMSWFTRLRGRATGFVYAGNGMGPFAVPALALLAAWVGWRDTLLIASASIFVMGLPLALFLRDRPQDYGLQPDGDPAPAPAAAEGHGTRTRQPAPGFSVAQAFRMPSFYLVGLANAVAGATQTVWLVHQVPHLQQVGFSLGMVGLLVAIYGAIQIPARIASGWVGDYWGRRSMFIACFVLQAAGIVIAANLSPDRMWLLPLFFLTMPVGHSAWAICTSTVVADYFGVQRYASIRGFMSTITMPLGLAAPVLAGWMFDRTESYRLIFMVYGGVTASGVLWAVLAGQPRHAPERQRATGQAGGPTGPTGPIGPSVPHPSPRAERGRG